MDRNAGGFVPRKGMRVISSDGEHVGDIDVAEHAYVIVQHGLFPQDYYIPLSAIVSHDDDAVYLDITKDEALERGLGNPMVAFTEPADSPQGPDTLLEDPDEAPVPQDITARDGVSPDLAVRETDDAIIAADEASRNGAIADDVPTDDEIIAADDAARDDTHSHNRQTIELHQEEASATTRPVERGSVRVRKEVVEERQTFEVPVVEEEVIVTRRRVDKDVPDPDAVFTEAHVEIPIRGQEVEIETRAHVVEEIDIDKTAHEHIAEVTETIRHEEARVEGDNIEMDTGTDDVARDRSDDNRPR